MKNWRIVNLAVLCLLVGSAGLVLSQKGYAQDEQEAKPAQAEEPKNDARPEEAKHEGAKPIKQGNYKQQQEDRQEDKDKKDTKQEPRDQGAQENRDHPAQANGKGSHIPDDKFKAHFGHSHTFTAKTVIVQGRPQFSYGGYNFQLVDVWPAGWAYTDECYIDYVDGEYFLFDLLHPGVRVAIFVVL
jgi:hypothetical protein